MENKSAPPRKITRRHLLRSAAAGAGLLIAGEALKPIFSLVPAAQAAEQQPPVKEPGLIEGKEREFQIKQLKGFLGEFVTPKALEMFGNQGLFPEDQLKVKAKDLRGGGSAVTFEVQGTDGLPYTVGFFVNRPGGLIREATIFADRGRRTMSQYAEAVKTWLKAKDAEFKDMLEEFEEDEEPMMQTLQAQTPSLPAGGNSGNTILIADIPAPPLVYKHPDLNIYYAISQNSVTLYPDGQAVFHREMDPSVSSFENVPV